MFDRCRDGGRRTWQRQFPRQVRVQIIELPHLAVGPPTQITIPGIPQVGMGDRLKTTRPVESGGEFVSDAFALSKAVLARGADGLLIQTLGVELPAFDAGDLRADQRGSISEILRAVLPRHRSAYGGR